MNYKVSDPRYNSQRDNLVDPYITCFPTSVAMTTRTLEQFTYGRQEILREDLDDVIIHNIESQLSRWRKVARKIGKWTSAYHPRTIWAFWESWFEENSVVTGYKAKYYHQDQESIKEMLMEQDTPVIVGNKFTHGGHVVAIIGFDDDRGSFLVNDPYGNPMTGYREHNGREVWVPYHFSKWGSQPLSRKYNTLLISKK